MNEHINNKTTLPYAAAIIKLLQGPVFRDEDKYWLMVRDNQVPLAGFFGEIGLTFIYNEQDGFAFIQQTMAMDDESEDRLPRLVRRYPLTYEQSLLCVMLREWMEEFDSTPEKGTRLIVSRKQIWERIDIFLKDTNNLSRVQKQFDTTINQLSKSIGILRIVKEDENDSDNSRFEVRRIIKAIISNEKLEDFMNKLMAHAERNGN